VILALLAFKSHLRCRPTQTHVPSGLLRASKLEHEAFPLRATPNQQLEVSKIVTFKQVSKPRGRCGQTHCVTIRCETLPVCRDERGKDCPVLRRRTGL